MSYCERMDLTEFESHQPLTREQYLARLPDIDRNNLERVIELFEEVTQEAGREVCLAAVGGTISEPLPRPDIDLVVVFPHLPTDPKREGFPDYYQFTMAQFTDFREFIGKLLEKDPRFQVMNVYEPEIDQEYGSPSILRHEGSIKVVDPGGGSTLEFMRRSYKSFFTQDVGQKQPYVILTQISHLST